MAVGMLLVLGTVGSGWVVLGLRMSLKVIACTDFNLEQSVFISEGVDFRFQFVDENLGGLHLFLQGLIAVLDLPN